MAEMDTVAEIFAVFGTLSPENQQVALAKLREMAAENERKKKEQANG